MATAFTDVELTSEKIPEEPRTEPLYDFSEAVPDEKAATDSLPSEVAEAPPPTAASPSVDWDHRWDDIEDEPELILSDPGLQYRTNTASLNAKVTANLEAEPKSFVKDLPPGATYRPGDVNSGLRPGVIQEYSFDDPAAADPQRRRLVVMLALLIVGAAILAYLALFWQRRQTAEFPAPSAAATAVYSVEAALGPSDLPPTDVYVVSSPPDSSKPPDSLIAVVSPPGRQIELDTAGTWQLQAKFEKRASEIVTFQVPQDHAVSFTLPPESPSQP